MRLAFCNATRRWGGVKTWSLEFAAALQRKGHTLVIYGRPGSFIDRARMAGLDAVPVDFGPDFNPFAIAKFYQEFRRRAMDAVLVNVGRDLRTAGVAAKLAGIPLVQRIGLPGDMDNTLKVRCVDAALQPHYLCPCRYIRDGMLAELPWISPRRTSVVYSAKMCVPSAPQHIGTPLRILSTSQVNPNKGHAELAYTLAALASEDFTFHWDIAGEGSSLDDTRALCGRLGLEKFVTFHGFMQNVAEVLRDADIFVLSSYTEGLPNALLEGMAHGLVPIAHDVGGVRECWPMRGEEFPLFPVPLQVGDVERDWSLVAATDLPLYSSLRQVLSASPKTILAWKSVAWQHCKEHFSIETQATALEHFFAERIAGKHPHTTL